MEAVVTEIEDVERGQRIRELRQSRRLTEQALWERMCEIGGPKKDGRPFVSFRMVQRYGQGAGISWKATRVLAQALDTTEDYILRGEGERRQPRPARSIDTDLAERLAKIEERMDAPSAVHRLEGELEERIGRIEDTLEEMRRSLDNLHRQREGFMQLLAEQERVLEEIAGLVGQEALAKRADKALEASIERARSEFAAAERQQDPDPAATGGTTAPRGSRKA